MVIKSPYEAATAGRYVRPKGLDFEKGQVLLKSE